MNGASLASESDAQTVCGGCFVFMSQNDADEPVQGTLHRCSTRYTDRLHSERLLRIT